MIGGAAIRLPFPEMDLLYVLDYRFARTPDGVIWADTLYDATFWPRYLSVFDRVRVLARVRDVPAARPEWRRVENDFIAVAPVPHYDGPFGYARRARQVARAIEAHYRPDEAVILRIPSQVATCAAAMLRRKRHPFGVEVAGDPNDAFARGAVRHPLRTFFRRWYVHHQRWQCSAAASILYVADYLKRRYPPRPEAFSLVCSDAQLFAQAYAGRPRVHTPKTTWRLVTVGSLAQMYKGVDVLLDAMAIAVRNGLDLQLTIVGDGKHRPELERRTAALGLTSRVTFRGQLARFVRETGEACDPVRDQLEAADLFVLPSKTEGLPRALLEAMAAGLPCIGSAVGGIPQLLDQEDLVPPGAPLILAARITHTLADPARLDRMSARNLATARMYDHALLSPRREAFLRSVRDVQQAWRR